MSPIHIIYEVQEGFAEVHPWLSATLVKGCPLVITGRSSDLKCALAQLKEVDGTEGWQWVTLSIYDMGGEHPVYRYGERQAVIASPERLKSKVPKDLAVDQSDYASMCTLPLVVWAYDTFGILTHQSGCVIGGICICERKRRADQLIARTAEARW